MKIITQVEITHSCSSLLHLQMLELGQMCICQTVPVERIYLSPVSTTRIDGPSWRSVNSASGNARPSTRVMETGHPSTRAVNSGSGNRALQILGASSSSGPWTYFVVNRLHDTTVPGASTVPIYAPILCESYNELYLMYDEYNCRPTYY